MIARMHAREAEPWRVFVVRISDESSSCSLRGHVRDGVTGAYRAFTSWRELTSFLADQLATNPSSKEEIR
jgi:hypothetical protein